jgi:hypothetical protein
MTVPFRPCALLTYTFTDRTVVRLRSVHCTRFMQAVYQILNGVQTYV